MMGSSVLRLARSTNHVAGPKLDRVVVNLPARFPFADSFASSLLGFKTIPDDIENNVARHCPPLLVLGEALRSRSKSHGRAPTREKPHAARYRHPFVTHIASKKTANRAFISLFSFFF